MNHSSRLTLPALYLSLSASLLAGSISTFAAAPEIFPELETRSHFDDEAGNYTDVDDPAIWIHPQQPQHSIVVGTLKEGGLDVYDLQGKLMQHIPAAAAPACASASASEQENCQENSAGRLNNADLVYNFSLGSEKVDLVVASDRGRDTLAVYKIDYSDKTNIRLIDITAAKQTFIFSKTQDEVNQGRTAYGLATVSTDKVRAYVSQNNTPKVAILELYDNGDGRVAYRQEKLLEFPATFPLDNGGSWTPCTGDDGDLPQFEGMVADIENNRLYLGQENVGVWRVALDAPTDQSSWELFGKTSDFGVPYSRGWSDVEEEYLCTLDKEKDPGYGSAQLQADVEGLTLYRGGKGYLLVSSQGNNTVAVYEANGNNKYIGSFTVTSGTVDGVNETDGMMVVNNQLPGAFAEGLVVMQDGENVTGSTDQSEADRESSNFKFISWGNIARTLKLDVDTTDHSRD
ncbi:MAG: 3-phytase [Halieaceae bacterium]|jgi:3-phytase